MCFGIVTVVYILELVMHIVYGDKNHTGTVHSTIRHNSFFFFYYYPSQAVLRIILELCGGFYENYRQF